MEMDKIVKESYPYSIYNELNEQVKSATDEKYCNEFKKLNNDYQGKSIELCKKVTHLLDFVYKKDKSKEFKEYCSHYKYWVYEEISKLFNDDTPENIINDVIDKFNKLQTTLFINRQKNYCSYRFDLKTLGELNSRKVEKKLYDYFKNYNTIKSRDKCSNVSIEKYKGYLEGIKILYENEKDYCCFPGTWDCSNYFLTCNSEFDPSKLLSAFQSKGNGSCDGLNRITANFDEEELNTVVTDAEILNSISHGACFNLDKHELTSSDTKHPRCSLLATSVTLTRSVRTDGNSGATMTDNGSPPDGVNSVTRDNREEGRTPQAGASQGQQGTIEKAGGSRSTEKLKIEAPSEKDSPDTFRWKFNEKGTLQCPTKSRDKNEELLCNFMEELVEGNFATQMEGTKRYKVKAGRSWSEDDLKPARERVRKRRSANESNILNNIFVRISTGVTLFTPFGSRLRRDRKRKQRYRKDFTDLYTRKRPRRFLKRTYRHSDKRRFNVVNIEDELHS
ncbi:PIR Superfamily Protein [Plasmodium malariae]|uniref:PIR Superfamily Protein n=1 Tax=Plasmodium malariae TaxID=5858 RepID=A0A1A8X372_PLAMA|nr:PIR Superfamily Protein [Plasmodium malariae]